jgi:hypothetical protein
MEGESSTAFTTCLSTVKEEPLTVPFTSHSGLLPSIYGQTISTLSNVEGESSTSFTAPHGTIQPLTCDRVISALDNIMSMLSDIKEHPLYGRTSPSIHPSFHSQRPSMTPASDHTRPITVDTELASMFQPSSTPIHLDPRLTNLSRTPTPDGLRGYSLYNPSKSIVRDDLRPEEEEEYQSQLLKDLNHMFLPNKESDNPISRTRNRIHSEAHPSINRPPLRNLSIPRAHLFPDYIHLPSPWEDNVTFENDDEPDEKFPQPTPNEKGIRIGGVVKLRQDGGFSNYRNWRIELDNIFDADIARFNTAVKRIAFATKYFDSSMKVAWRMQAQSHPHLRRHWRKFLRWIELDHLHGDPTRYEHLQEFYNMTQGEMEGPAPFCIRLTKLATTLGRKISIEDFFPRLQERFQDALIQDRPVGRLDSTWLIYAQNVWDTLKSISSSTKRKKANQSDDESPSRPPKRVSITRRVSEERNRRRENNLCLLCGKDNHQEPACPIRRPRRKDNPRGQEKATQTQPRVEEHLNLQGSLIEKG